MSRNLSMLAEYDDIRRCVPVLTDGTAEEEFLRVLKLQLEMREENMKSSQETSRIQKELDVSLQTIGNLETKLYHARRLLDMETKARKEAEHARDQLERKMVTVADYLQTEPLKDETRDKLAFLNTLPRKRKSLIARTEEHYGGEEINSTGSFLADLSITRSEDDFLEKSRDWQRHRPSGSMPAGISKRSRLSGGCASNAAPISTGRRSFTQRQIVNGNSSQLQENMLNTFASGERICATTKVTIPQDGIGAIRAESTIESLPIGSRAPVIVVEEFNENQADGLSPRRCSPIKTATAPPMTPMSSNKAGVAFLQQSITPTTHSPHVNMKREHNFASKTFIRMDSCAQCGKKIRFGALGLRCRNCNCSIHSDCRHLLSTACVPQSNTPISKTKMGPLSDYTPSVPPMIPPLIVHCVNEIETRGLNEVGIYRVSGSERDVKALKENFLRGKNTPSLSNADIHVLAGCVKEFLRTLAEPIIPSSLFHEFYYAAANGNEHDLCKLVNMLPQPNRDTLAFLILHFQRIAECPQVLMPLDNMARILAPTMVGNSSPIADTAADYKDIPKQQTVLNKLFKIPTEYWTQFVAITDSDKENTRAEATAPLRTPSHKFKESLYATPLKSTVKKRKFYNNTPPFLSKK